jgi:hypothetical protein
MSSVDPYCERARAWASLDLDGELGDLENILLEEHLHRCHPCAAFVESIRVVASAVRSAPLELPVRPLELPVRRRIAPVVTRLASVAAILALATGLGFLGSALSEREGAIPASTGPEIALLSPSSVDREIKNLRAKQPVPQLERVTPPGRLGGFV